MEITIQDIDVDKAGEVTTEVIVNTAQVLSQDQYFRTTSTQVVGIAKPLALEI